jgi:hypothetical protein
VNCPPFLISLSFWVELVGACNSIMYIHDLSIFLDVICYRKKVLSVKIYKVVGQES